MSMDLQRFHATYFEESRENLDAMEAGLLAMEEGNTDPDLINAVFRAAHSIKGGAATFGFEDMTALTHILETLLDEMRAGKRSLNSFINDAMLASVDVLRALLHELEHGQKADPNVVRDMKLRLENVMHSDNGAAPAAASVVTNVTENGWSIEFIPHRNMFSTGSDPIWIIRELKSLGPLKVKAHYDQLPSFEELDPLQAYLHWHLELEAPVSKNAVEEAFIWVVDDCDVVIQPLLQSTATTEKQTLAELTQSSPTNVTPILTVAAQQEAVKSAPESAETSIRVSVDKVDALINLVGELVITHAMLKQVSNTLDPSQFERLFAGLDLLERNTRDLQEAVIGVRMLPVDAVFRRFPRLVRDLSGRLGKQVRLKTIGEKTELDKGLIERIADPLMHLVRNAIDHGLEMPEERRAAGKDEEGTITLAASHQGGHIVIEVSDDGHGLNRDRILQKAIERGLPVPENPTDSQVWDLIFQPGFSTADVVTDLSGRGVGMDVVRRNIQALGGEVSLESQRGHGTRIEIKLPLTLAILDGMAVSVGEETLILPLSYVLEALQPLPEDIRHVAGEKNRVLRVRGEYLPLLSLKEYYNYGDAENGNILVVVVEAEGHKMALEVDELLGQQQVVVKNIENNYRRIHGISGATILGDGRVALIVDIGGITRSMRISKAA